MKSKKVKISIGIVCLAVLIGILAWSIQSIAQQSVDYQIRIVRLRQNSGLGFAISRVGDGSSSQVNAFVEILNLVGVNQQTEEERPLYCLQAGLGFYNIDPTKDASTVKYDKKFDMKLVSDKKIINDEYGTEKKDQNNSEGKENEKINLIIAKPENDEKYNKVVWLADHMYVPGQDSVEDKIELLKRVGVINEDELEQNGYSQEVKRKILSEAKLDGRKVVDEEIAESLSDEEVDKLFYSECFISDDIMETVQQLAFWYIIHDDEQNSEDDKAINYHHKTLPDLYYTNQEKNNSEDTDKTSDYVNHCLEKENSTVACHGSDGSQIFFKIGVTYQNNAEKYYKWLIDEIEKQKGTEYFDKVKYDDENYGRKIPVQVNDTVLKVEEDGEDYIVGPYEIERVTKGDFTLTAKISAKDYKVLDKDKNEAESIEKTIGEDLGKYNFYLKVPKAQISNLTVDFKVSSNNRLVTLLLGQNAQAEQPVLFIDNKPEDYNKTVKLNTFDLALRKVITKVTDKDGNEKDIINVQKQNNARTVTVDTSNLNKTVDGNVVTTATYNHRKDPVLIETGDIVTYTITIYNEGNADGRATQIIDVLPDGLEFVKIVSGDYEVFNPSEDGSMPKDRIVFKKKGEENLKGYTGEGELSSESIVIECKVTANASANTKILTNIALISEEYNAETETTITNQKGLDRDSEPLTYPNEAGTREMDSYIGNSSNKDDLSDNNYFYKGQQDDDDFEKLVLKGANFDLSLRKYITEVETINDKGESVKTQHDRAPQVDVSKLNTTVDGKVVTTAEYNHPKNPVTVNVGDVVTYTIRVYNEGDVDGYVAEITDYLPQWLEFLPDDSLNKQYLWNYREEGNKRIISTPITAKDNATGDTLYKDRKNGKLLKAFDPATMDTLDYIDVQIRCKVLESANNVKLQPGEKVTNIAVITKMTDDNGSDIEKDRDSKVDYENIPSDENLPGYKDDEIESGKSYIPGQEDDDDFEKVIIQVFDLALRKFITEVEGVPVNNRYPVVNEGTDGRDFNYEHTKEPVEVVSGNTVIYTIRIFNEGTTDGYASEVMDDLPEGIVFLPEHETNVEYRWVMYKESTSGEADYEYAGKKYVKTDNANEADIIVTDYLDKEVSEAAGRDSLLKAYDKEKGITDGNPDYRDIKVAFKVTEANTSDRIIVNTAEISRDEDKDGNEVTDEDSTPGNGEENEDDIDKEYLKLKYFDLALLKWVSQVSVTQDGKTTVTDTGHTVETARDEDPVLVTIDSKKLDSVVVKFIYDIRVENQGEIEGYATELKDHIPEGLKFVAEDNPDWEQVDENTITTNALKDTLLQPGDTASVRVVLTWINGSKNLNLKVNYAEISEDYNEWGVPDIDSTPDNWVDTPGEDDDDDAPVLLTLKTGQMPVYFMLGVGILAVATTGIYLIKKYVYDRMI